MAKYITRIELVRNFADLHGSRGGYWEDRGYEWYAGIRGCVPLRYEERAGRWRAKWILPPGSSALFRIADVRLVVV
jgi:DMSO/TMAO reductase YedYZ molybdopterin-dependent catalytic subunit